MDRRRRDEPSKKKPRTSPGNWQEKWEMGNAEPGPTTADPAHGTYPDELACAGAWGDQGLWGRQLEPIWATGSAGAAVAGTHGGPTPAPGSGSLRASLGPTSLLGRTVEA